MATYNTKEAFLLYTHFYESISNLTLVQKGRLLDYIFLFARGEQFEIKDPVVAMAFSFIKERMEHNANKYAEVVEKRRRAGRSHRGNQYTQNKEHMEQVSQNGTDNVSVTDIVNESGIEPITNVTGEDIEKEMPSKEVKKKTASEKRFVKPTPEEVQAYCDERGNGIDGQHFCDFYESKGWKIGKETMKDWKAAVRTWEQRNGFKPAKATKKGEPAPKLGVGEFIAQDGTRRYGTGNLPPVPMDAPPRPDNSSLWSRETNTWIPAGV